MRVIDPLNQDTAYTYTENGQVETVTLPNNTVIRYEYNGLGQRISERFRAIQISLTASEVQDRLVKCDDLLLTKK